MLKKYACVLGGNTHLGKHIIRMLKKRSIAARWSTLNIDYKANLEATENHVLDPSAPLLEQAHAAFEKAKEISEEYDAIIVATPEEAFQTSSIQNLSIFEEYEKQWAQVVYTHMIGAKIAGTLLAPCGLMVLQSSLEAFERTNPNNLAVNLAKMQP